MYKGSISKTRIIDNDFYELKEEREKRLEEHGQEIVDNSPLLRVVEKWLRSDYAQQLIDAPLELMDGKPMTKWDTLKDNMKEFGDKYYNYYS